MIQYSRNKHVKIGSSIPRNLENYLFRNGAFSNFHYYRV